MIPGHHPAHGAPSPNDARLRPAVHGMEHFNLMFAHKGLDPAGLAPEPRQEADVARHEGPGYRAASARRPTRRCDGAPRRRPERGIGHGLHTPRRPPGPHRNSPNRDEIL